MARSKPSARDALIKVLLDCGAETLDPPQFKQLIRSAMALGIDESLKRLASP